MAHLWQRYRDEHAEQRIAANMVYSGKAILPQFGGIKPDDITTARCREYIGYRTAQGRKPGTIWTELNHLAIVLGWAHKHRHIPHPVAITRPPKPAPRDRRLTSEESRRLLEAAEYPHVVVAIALMIHTAARIGAILDLTWDRVDFERGLITYANPNDEARRKGRATVPMTDELRQRLLVAKDGSVSIYVVEWAGKKVSSIKRGFARTVDRAGLKDVTPHVLRHTAASRMAERRIPMAKIAAVLGHSDSRTTERIYAKFSPDYLRDAVAALELSGVPSSSSEPVERRSPPSDA